MPSDFGLPEVYIHPGEWRMVDEPSILRTVLGSCVGVTFWAPQIGVAVLFHAMLPRFGGRQGTTVSLSDCRKYVDFGIREIASFLEAKGAKRGDTQVKLFGGADVLAVVDAMVRPTVGRLNREAALRVLEEEGFQVSASRLGGDQGYHLSFHTNTGEVRVRRLDSVAATEESGDKPRRGQARG